MSDAPPDGAKGRRAGQAVFALAWLGVSVGLLTQLGAQTRVVEKTGLVAQPRFWPALSLALMTLCAALHLWHLPRRRAWRAEWAEVRRWGQPLEFALWFMAYVWAVPLSGFLPASLVFAPALTWRMGYRAPVYFGAALVFALLVVVVFKGFLGVRIPGGALYELLPGRWRGFAILWL